MPGFLANVTSTVACSHQGQAKPVQPNPRVTVMGQPTVFFTTTPADYTVSQGRGMRMGARKAQ